MFERLLAALALMLIMEGLLPFFSPGRWREFFMRATQLGDGQIRFIGLTSMMIGLAVLLLMGD